MKTHILYNLTIRICRLRDSSIIFPGLIDCRWFKRTFGIRRFNELRKTGGLVKA